MMPFTVSALYALQGNLEDKFIAVLPNGTVVQQSSIKNDEYY
jgi:hypothetical protein